MSKTATEGRIPRDSNSEKVTQAIIFLLLFISGACSLSYQILWTRLAYASFGIITPVLSVVISVFMLGLSLGSWLAGKYAKSWTEQSKQSAAMFYGAAEGLIAVGGLVVPTLFAMGARLLLTVGELNSLTYLVLSALVIAAAILPWSMCMGATLPLMIAFIKESNVIRRGKLSFLYMANVLGALVGTIVTTFVLIELLGFRTTLALAATANILIACISFYLAKTCRASSSDRETERATVSDLGEASGLDDSRESLSPRSPGNYFLILFGTGLLSMAMEVVWTRGFFYVLGNEVYSFASLLSTYLLATFIGSYLYRKHLASNKVFSIDLMIVSASLFALIPIVVNDPRIHIFEGAIACLCCKPLFDLQGGGLDVSNTFFLCKAVSVASVLISIAPLCACLGYLTPQIIETYSQDEPDKVGRAYAVNVLGCIIGPLLAAYVILPMVGAKMGVFLLAVPFVILALVTTKTAVNNSSRLAIYALFVGALLVGQFVCLDYEQFLTGMHKHHEIRRDYAATSVAVGEGFKRNLLVNGVGVVNLCQGAKSEGHLPLVLLDHPPESVLEICFGMGTTYRSLLSWNVKTICIELVPGVLSMFGFFYDDAAKVMSNSNGTVVIDDGRRFLSRTDLKFDVITVDPPPPLNAAGLGLLFSEEFYTQAKSRLKPGGIVHMFVPDLNNDTVSAVVRSCTNRFPYVRAFTSNGCGAFHMIASMKPINLPTLDQTMAKMPKAAQADLTEWSTDNLVSSSPREAMQETYDNEIPLSQLMSPDLRVKITDDHPFNEYFLLRTCFGGGSHNPK